VKLNGYFSDWAEVTSGVPQAVLKVVQERSQSRNPRSSAPSPEFFNLFLIWKWRVLMHYWWYFMRFRAARE